MEKRRRKSQTEGGAPFRGKPETSPRENPRVGKIPTVPTVPTVPAFPAVPAVPAVAACVATSRKPVLEARFSSDLPSGNSGNCQQSPRSPRSPRGVGGLPGVPGMATGSRRPERLGSKEGKEGKEGRDGREGREAKEGREGKERKEPTSDVQKRALVLLASSKSAAVKERTETFIQKHKIALPLGGTTADEPNGSGATEPRELCDTQLPQPDPTDEKGTLPSSGRAAEPAESTAQSWCAPLDALTFAWLQGTFQWCIQCMIGCVLLSLRCCFGSINCLKPILVEEAPRRRYQDKVAVRTC